MPRPTRLGLVLALSVCALAAGSSSRAAGSRDVLSYGDSLSVGTNLYLGRYLHGWNLRSLGVAGCVPPIREPGPDHSH